MHIAGPPQAALAVWSTIRAEYAIEQQGSGLFLGGKAELDARWVYFSLGMALDS
jgi:hypothetical protein